jgi:spermidine synthase
MSNQIAFKTRTQYGPVWINKDEDILQLKFDRLSIQSEISISSPQQLRMKNLQYLMGLLLFIRPPKNVLLLGVGGGSLIQFLRYYMPQCHITGVEYDAELLQFVQKNLLLPEAGENIDYQITDARDYIKQCNKSFDLIIVDIFTGDESPDWLLEDEYIDHLKRLLSSRGALGYNLLVNNEKSFDRFYQQLGVTFANQTLMMETEDYENLLVYALNFKAKKKSISQHLQHAQELHEKYQLPFNETLSMIFSMNGSDSEIIY